MVAPPELSRALKGHEVIGLFHDAEDAPVPTDIGADAAGVFLGDIEADAAVDDLRLELRQRLGQRLHFVRRALEKKEGQPLSGLGADAREPLQRFNEPRDRLTLPSPPMGERDTKERVVTTPTGERDTEARVVTIMRPLHPHAGDLETGGELAHLGLDHLLRLPERLVARGKDQILEHLRILGIDDLAVDLDREELLLAIALDGDHAPARRRVDLLPGDLLLQRLHLLLQLLRLLHDVAEAFHWPSPSSGTRGRTATTSPWNVATAACTAG